MPFWDSKETYTYSKGSWSLVTSGVAWQDTETKDEYLTRMNFDSTTFYKPNYFFDGIRRITELMYLELYGQGSTPTGYRFCVFVDVGKDIGGKGVFFLLGDLQDLFQFYKDIQPLYTMPMKLHSI